MWTIKTLKLQNVIEEEEQAVAGAGAGAVAGAGAEVVAVAAVAAVMVVVVVVVAVVLVMEQERQSKTQNVHTQLLHRHARRTHKRHSVTHQLHEGAPCLARIDAKGPLGNTNLSIVGTFWGLRLTADCAGSRSGPGLLEGFHFQVAAVSEELGLDRTPSQHCCSSDSDGAKRGRPSFR